MNSRRDERVETLRAATARKQEDAEAKVRRALMSMRARGTVIDFKTVATEAGVSSSYLYKHQTLRAEIASLRTPPPPRVEQPAAAARSKEASNAVKLAVAISALSELRREVAVLREENARLQGDLAALRASRRG